MAEQQQHAGNSGAYLIRGAAILGGAAEDLLIRDGIIAARGRQLDADGAGVRDATVIDAAGLVALPGMVDIHTHLREPGREDAETVETGTRAAALGGYTAVHAMANSTPVADTAGVVEQVLTLGRTAGWVDVRPVGAVTVGLAGEQLAETRRHGRLPRPGPRLLRRRHLRARPGADAPRARIRQGVRRRRRPARAGTPPHRRRPDERGRGLRRARPGRLAGRRRGEHHRPRRAAGRARRLPPARLPRLHGRLRGDHPLGQVPRRQRHGRGHPAPPLAHRRARPAATTRSTRSTRRCAPTPTSRRCAPRWPTARSTSSAPTTPRTRASTRNASGRRRPWA